MGRIIGLDFGSKTVGVAVSDPMKVIASPLETIVRDRESKMRPTYRRILEIASQTEAEIIVVGDPVNMDGSRGERAEKSAAFAEELRYRLECEGMDIPVVMWDERLTTISADEILSEAEVAVKDRKTYIDKIAAAFILEDWMKNNRKEEEKNG
ncbi:MAG: Holliday junction resolvase RuvX [Lachnospiraceae bacterium]|nr:Holliday junction resolvase RuvX [Lachnospiraceae bacterium]